MATEALPRKDTTAQDRTRSRKRGLFAERAGNQRPAGSKALLWFGVILTMIFCLFPFYWLVNTSLKTGAELSTSQLFPSHPSLDNFSSIFKNSDFTHALQAEFDRRGMLALDERQPLVQRTPGCRVCRHGPGVIARGAPLRRTAACGARNR